MANKKIRPCNLAALQGMDFVSDLKDLLPARLAARFTAALQA